MSRPMLNHRIQDLEDLFRTAKGDPNVLRQLEHELGFRHVPSAVTLREEVHAALAQLTVSGTRPAAPAPPPPSSRPERPAVPATAPPPARSEKQMVQTTPSASVGLPSPRGRPTRIPPATEAEAYQALKVPPGSPWEALEKARRRIVDQAFPSRLAHLSEHDRERVDWEAHCANEAARLLWKAGTSA